jgi:hypothetical protein
MEKLKRGYSYKWITLNWYQRMLVKVENCKSLRNYNLKNGKLYQWKMF